MPLVQKRCWTPGNHRTASTGTQREGIFLGFINAHALGILSYRRCNPLTSMSTGHNFPVTEDHSTQLIAARPFHSLCDPSALRAAVNHSTAQPEQSRQHRAETSSWAQPLPACLPYLAHQCSSEKQPWDSRSQWHPAPQPPARQGK